MVKLLLQLFSHNKKTNNKMQRSACWFLINLILLFNILNFHQAKMYKDYASFLNCFPKNECRFKRLQDKMQFFARGVENPCSEDLVDNSFLLCLDKFFLCGYLPILYKNFIPDIDTESGIRIANGLDLGQMTSTQLVSRGVPNLLVDRLSPFLGLKGYVAYNALITTNFTLNEEEGKVLDYISIEFPFKFLEFMYNNENTFNNNFKDIPLGIKTALISIYRSRGYQFDQKMWDLLLKNKWNEIYDYIRKTDVENYRGKLESSLIYPYMKNKKNKNIKTVSVFLIDISDINELQFNYIKKFVIEFIKGNEIEDITNDYHYSVVLFDKKTYTVVNFENYFLCVQKLEALKFSDYNYSNHSDFENNADQNLIRNTKKGLEESYKLIFQYLKKRNIITLDDENVNINDYLNIFLITNGKSSVDVEETSRQIRSRGVNIISIGVNSNSTSSSSIDKDPFLNSTLNELKQISGGETNVIYNQAINYDNLSCYNEKLKLFYQFNHVALLKGKKYSGARINKKAIHYYKIELNPNPYLCLHFKIVISENNPDNRLSIFASYLDPFPDEFSYDYYNSGLSKNLTKIIMIKGNIFDLGLKSKYYDIRSSLRNEVFVAVESNSNKEIAYSIETYEYDRSYCISGSTEDVYENEIGQINNENELFWLLVVIVILSIIFIILFIFYLIRCYTKREDQIPSNLEITNYNGLSNS